MANLDVAKRAFSKKKTPSANTKLPSETASVKQTLSELILAAMKKLGGKASCPDIRKVVAENDIGIPARKIAAEIKRMKQAK